MTDFIALFGFCQIFSDWILTMLWIQFIGISMIFLRFQKNPDHKCFRQVQLNFWQIYYQKFTSILLWLAKTSLLCFKLLEIKAQYQNYFLWKTQGNLYSCKNHFGMEIRKLTERTVN